jgi:hypothetical protein
LAKVPDLTPEQQDLIKRDIESKKLNIQNCQIDLADEPGYAAADKAQIQALKSGKGIEAANAAVVAARQLDMSKEPGYVAQDKSDAELDKLILKAFGRDPEKIK